MKNQLLRLLALALILWGCKIVPTVKTGGTKKNVPTEETYEEDLSSVRPRYSPTTISLEPRFETNPTVEVKPVPTKTHQTEITGHVNAQVAAVLDSMTARNKRVKFADGYRVQIYVGNVRTDVEAAKSYSYQVFPNFSPYMSFEQPTYRLKVGDFMTRSEAEKCLGTFRQKYPSAVIVTDKIDIKKSVLGN